jgi:hypothetical protein
MAWTHGWVAGLVAMGTQWPVIDLPYPDVPDAPAETGAGAWTVETAEAQVESAICRYVHQGRPLARPAEISQLRIDGTRATALVTSGSRIEWVHLELSGSEWRVVQTFAHR